MNVLVPTDGSEPAEAALDHAFERFADDDITALYVMDPVEGATAWGPGAGEDWLGSAEKRAERVLGEATERGETVGVEIDTDSVVGRPSRAIIDYAEEATVDQVVIGSHGRDGITRVLLGSVAETVIRRSPVPVTVVRHRE
jgi:nucleotide-binding universal stress UspA family protein